MDEFDSNEDIVNIENGLLNIHARELRKFLCQVLHPQDVFTAMQIFGYILLKSNEFEKAFMLFDSGNNGKSVFIKLIVICR